MDTVLSDASPVVLSRRSFTPSTPSVLSAPSRVVVSLGEKTVARSASDDATLRSWLPHTYAQPMASLGVLAPAAQPTPSKPLRVAIVFNGRQSPGANNVVCGASSLAGDGR